MPDPMSAMTASRRQAAFGAQSIENRLRIAGAILDIVLDAVREARGWVHGYSAVFTASSSDCSGVKPSKRLSSLPDRSKTTVTG